uniref:Uncharacterized protein n=1 Tax=Myotis myotis TaxID=51298 RepID=A0A7J7TJ94_MYOMY|nr:hypothetical protein mMyoMyo1_009075 [Myotis myotis]
METKVRTYGLQYSKSLLSHPIPAFLPTSQSNQKQRKCKYMTGAAVVRAPPLYSGDAGGRSPSGSARRRGGDATAAVIVRLGSAGRCLSRLLGCQFVRLLLSSSLLAADGDGRRLRRAGLAFGGPAAAG